MEPNDKRLQNLRHFTSDQDREQARINGAKGGKKAAETKRRRKAFSEAFEVLLSREFVDLNGNEITGVEALAAKMYQQAMDGDIRAFCEIRDTCGERPIQKVETIEISPETYDNVRKMLEDA